jgi:hypothetical protein
MAMASSVVEAETDKLMGSAEAPTEIITVDYQDGKS